MVLAALCAVFPAAWLAAGQDPEVPPAALEPVREPAAEPASEAAPQELAPVVRYRLDVALTPDADEVYRVIRGSSTVTWRNPTGAATAELYWHVYNNAWAGRDSLWLREARRLGDERLPRAWGGTEITRVRRRSDTDAAEGVDLPWTFVPHPDAPGDRTVLQVLLPEAVPPGGTVTVEMGFVATLPPAFRRSGVGGDYVHAAQWFPKLGVFEERDGVAAWNCEPYHLLTEFYSDFGDYELTLVLPNRYKGRIAASGSMVGDPVETREGDVTYHFAAQRVHDFAWTVDADFLVERRPFLPAEVAERENHATAAARAQGATEAERVAAALGREPEEVAPQPTEMLLFLQPEHAEYRERYFAALEKALYYFQLWYGPYPYETISLVDPAHAAQATGGMEYPRLITGGVSKGRARRSLDPEGVTVHEFGHQYWYGLVANDEFRDAWLDEGLNTFSTQRVLRRAYPPALATYSVLGRDAYGHPLLQAPDFESGDLRALLSLQRLELPRLPLLGEVSLELRRRNPLEAWLAELPEASYLPELRHDAVHDERSAFAADWADPLSRPTFALFAPAMRGVNAYRRPAMTLETMAGLMGEARWTRVMRHFHERWRFGHPRPGDFYAVVEEFGMGAQVGGDTGVAVDWPGFWEQAYFGNDALDFGVSRLVNLPSVLDPQALQRGTADDRWDVILEVRRYGGFRVPVEIEIRWDDGTSSRSVWDGEDWWWRYEVASSPRRAVRAEVDPDRRLLLDRNWLNNTRLAQPQGGRARNLAWRAMLWAEQVLHFYGGAG